MNNAKTYTLHRNESGWIYRAYRWKHWLFNDQDYGYSNFIKTVDTTLMGRKTFEQVLTFGEFPYKDKQNFVFTRHREIKIQEDIELIFESPIDFISKLKQKPGKNIWLVGGSQIISYCLDTNLIDEYIIAIHPVILGNGIPLFSNMNHPISLKFLKVEKFNTGLIDVFYIKK